MAYKLYLVLKFCLETDRWATAVRFEVIPVVNTGLQTQNMMEGAGLEKNPTERKCGVAGCRTTRSDRLARG